MGENISEIINKYVLGESGKEELEQAISLLEDPYHNLKLRPTLYNIWKGDEVDSIESLGQDEFSQLLNQIHHKINIEEKSKKKSKVKSLIINVSKVAAVLLIGLLIGFFIHEIKKTEPVYYTSIAPNGSVSQMLLPDNTMVYLNSGSEIKYTVDGVKGNREVFLTGEAWFQVTKNKQKPFVVHTSYYNINVLGTEFNVKAYPDDNEVATTLEKGSVQITSSEKFRLQSHQVLKPGEQLVYNRNQNSIELKKVKTKLYTSWKDNKLIFINMSLGELIKLLERKYGVDIEVSDPSILEYHYDGTIKDETIIEVMEILKHTLPIEYEILEQHLQIIKTNQNK
ncbi:MAG: FecR domain-containing protein [Bacteroidota bacterium]